MPCLARSAPARPVTDPAEAYAEHRRLRELRTALETTLDEMINLLDRLDGDPDLEAEDEHGTDLDTGEGEDTDSEPNLGATETINQLRAWKAPRGWAGFSCEPGEPSLGAPETGYGSEHRRGWMQATGAVGGEDEDGQDREAIDEREHDEAELEINTAPETQGRGFELAWGGAL